MSTEFDPHEIAWTKEKSSRVWDFISASDTYQKYNFGRLAGDSVIEFVRRFEVPLTGLVLDFGCGPGYFMEKLLARGVSCQGVDSSKASIELARGRLAHYSQFKGAALLQTVPANVQNESVDVVFLLDTVEHILADELTATVKELHRIIRTGGHIVVTTPNQENLKAGEVMCPECGCVFHRGQHVTSWNTRSLSSFMAECGFEPIVCQTILFRRNSRLEFLRDFIAFIRKHKKMNLIYIGKK